MLLKANLSDLSSDLRRLGDEIVRAVEDAAPTPSGGPETPSPRVLLAGMTALLDRLRAHDGGAPEHTASALRAATGAEPEALLEHGLMLLSQLSSIAAQAGLDSTAKALGELAVPFSCWLVRRGAELLHPESIVDALAAMANRLQDREKLTELFGLMGEIGDACARHRTQRPSVGDFNDPYRVLLINRGIVATRTHQPALMIEAFEHILERLPQEAAAFFREGMGEMQTIAYPEPVQAVMAHYYERSCKGQLLH